MGRIHSVFRTSFNISCGEFLVHVGTTESPLSCLGFNIDPGRMEGILPSVRPGDRAVFRSGTLRIYDKVKVSAVSYGKMETVDLRVHASDNLPDVALYQALAPMVCPDRIGITLDSAAWRAIDGLRSNCGNENALQEAIAFLLGRGKGLTPSGDDILMGFGAGLLAWSDPEPLRLALRRTLRQQTTDISVAYLRAMLDGYVNEDYMTLFNAVRVGQKENYEKLVEQISCHGHTSGCDSLLGLMTAIETLPASCRPA